MAVEFTKDELKDILLDSYELMTSLPAPRAPRYEIQSRSKIKNLPEALREFEDPDAAVMHFVKSASYFLPRSDAHLAGFLDEMLKKVRKIQKSENDPEKVREKIRYLVGYTTWGMDAVCNIFEKTDSDSETKTRLKTMVTAELKVLAEAEVADTVVKKIMEWKASAGKDRW